MTVRAQRLLGVLGLAAILGACEGEPPAVTTVPLTSDEYVDVGDYVIHYNALTTDVLTPEVARAMINITVMKKRGEGELNEPSVAEVDASATNLTGQRREMDLRLIEEQNAKYYVGFVRVTDEETLEFKVHVTPPGVKQPIEIVFRRQFFVDD